MPQSLMRLYETLRPIGFILTGSHYHGDLILQGSLCCTMLAFTIYLASAVQLCS